MVIARFSWARVGLLLCVLLPITALGVYFLYQHNLRDMGFWVFLVNTPYLACFAFTLLYELLFHGARAMWLENGQLVFVPSGLPGSLTSYLYRVRADDVVTATIDQINTNSLTWPRGIVVTRRDRGFNRPYGEAPAFLYSEPVEVVHARLCQVLEIKPGPVVTPIKTPVVVGNPTKE